MSAQAFPQSRLADVVCQAALDAGVAIMQVFDSDAGHRDKADCSPVTIADERAEAIICAALNEAFPDIPIVAEESAAAGIVPERLGQRFFLVDPLDGTKEFIDRRTDFTVNIALIEDGVPTAGVVLAPARRVAYLATDGKAFKASVDEGGRALGSFVPIRVRSPGTLMVAVASRSHRCAETDGFLRAHGITECISVGSSLKFCLLAEGEADIYPRFGRTMEWDTAAGDAVLRAAGGITAQPDGGLFGYGKGGDFANPPFICSNAHVRP